MGYIVVGGVSCTTVGMPYLETEQFEQVRIRSVEHFLPGTHGIVLLGPELGCTERREYSVPGCLCTIGSGTVPDPTIAKQSRSRGAGRGDGISSRVRLPPT